MTAPYQESFCFGEEEEELIPAMTETEAAEMRAAGKAVVQALELLWRKS
jgi:hypothetical protein